MDLREACAVYEWTTNEISITRPSFEQATTLLGDTTFKEAVSTLSNYGLAISLLIAVVGLAIIWLLSSKTNMNKFWLSIAAILFYGLSFIDVTYFSGFFSNKGAWFSPLLEHVGIKATYTLGISCLLCLVWILFRKNKKTG